jgi:hypothetical protein
VDPDTADCTQESCDDQDPCTSDLCIPGTGCTHDFNTLPCDDGDDCTASDTCKDGVCAGLGVPGCGHQGCGDGTCDPAEETCEACPEDCNPLHLGTCGAACDPTEAATQTCGPGKLCAPVANGALFEDAILGGNGFCGVPCQDDDNCEASVCVKLQGLEMPGLCAPTCQTQEDCGAYHTCLVNSGQSLGYCLPAQACDLPAGTGPNPCLPVQGLATPGLRGVACYGGFPGTCPWTVPCVPFAADDYHGGLCLAPEPTCVPLGDDCLEGRDCRPLGGPAFGAGALFCTPNGSALEGESCDNSQTETCAAGLFCLDGLCVKTCDLQGQPCLDGTCTDLTAGLYLPPGALAGCVAICGNGTCEAGELCATCPNDCCASACGDGNCGGNESCDSCPNDCGPCETCGDGNCGEGEDCLACPDDCQDCPVCGDAVCAPGQETCQTCEDDCGPCSTTCGDESCGPTETCIDCPEDCGDCTESCGDQKCALAEQCWTCPEDCGPCPWTCGNGTCDPGEGCLACPADCPIFGSSACSGACDPATIDSGCTNGRVCVPAVNGLLNTQAFLQGNGVCAQGCELDSDCGGALACLPFAGLDQGGLCGPACSDQNPCAEGLSCVPKPATKSPATNPGVCFAGPLCSLEDGCGTPLTACVPFPSADQGQGLCLPGCWGANAAGCQAPLACILRSDPVWHSGTCLGGDPACNPLTNLVCPQGQTCVQLGGLALGGSAGVCVKAGSAPSGQPCSPAAPCAHGLFCFSGHCHSYCDPAMPSTCVGGTCADLGPEVNLPEGELGVCLKQ